jgi:DNA mismatch repair protein MutL
MTIRRLSVRLAGQIAAGEVVERQSSVVKELLENSVDAGAKSVRCDLEGAGRVLIRVRDDGSGIPKDELALALAPHATSKISCEEDLSHITTLGFRGEALASIAAVSKLTLSSRTAEERDGFCVSCLGPQMDPSIMPCPHGVGTTVEVRELFFNTPARRRFLRSDRTELARIRDVFTRCAMAHPETAFELWSDGRQLVKARAAHDEASRMKRLALLAGAEFSEDPIAVSCSDPQLQVGGIALMPQDAAAGGAEKCYLFLNGRPIADRLAVHAVREACARFSPGRTLPRCVLYLKCDPSEVDVNVHPRKDEVRFHNGAAVHDLIEQALFSALCAERERRQEKEGDLFASLDAGAAAERAARPSAPGGSGPDEGASGGLGAAAPSELPKSSPSAGASPAFAPRGRAADQPAARHAASAPSASFSSRSGAASHREAALAQVPPPEELPDFPDGQGSFIEAAKASGDLPPLASGNPAKARIAEYELRARGRAKAETAAITEAPGPRPGAPALLGMPAPGVALVGMGGRYLLVQVKALASELAARSFRKAVEGGLVEKHALAMPFAVRCDAQTLKALKRNAAALERCGIEAAFRKGMAEIRTVPPELASCDLASFSQKAFSVIAASAGLASGECPEQLARAVGEAAASGLGSGAASAQAVLSQEGSEDAVRAIMGHGAADPGIPEMALEMMEVRR